MFQSKTPYMPFLCIFLFLHDLFQCEWALNIQEIKNYITVKIILITELNVSVLYTQCMFYYQYYINIM